MWSSGDKLQIIVLIVWKQLASPRCYTSNTHFGRIYYAVLKRKTRRSGLKPTSWALRRCSTSSRGIGLLSCWWVEEILVWPLKSWLAMLHLSELNRTVRSTCPLCGVEETASHFLGQCRMVEIIRVKFFGTCYTTASDIVDIILFNL